MTSKIANRESLDRILDNQEILMKGMSTSEGDKYEYYSVIVKPGGKMPKLFMRYHCGLIFGKRKYDIKVMDILGMKWSDNNVFLIVDILGERIPQGGKIHG